MARSVLVTGGANGIGLASAEAFCAAGYNVVIADLDQGSAIRAAQEINGPAIGCAVDVRSKKSIEAAFLLAEKEFGPLDVVHANAGVSSMKPALELSEQDWDFNFDVNAKGVFLTNQVAVRHFLDHKTKGAIVNTASLAAKVGAPLLAHYSASKFAVVGWSQALAREHARDGIRVNCVCPGFVKTPMQEREVEWEAQLLGCTSEEVIRSYIAQTPLGRLETPQDVAGVVVFLASESAGFMTGQAVNVTGGVYMG
ncbi:3-oxoacyl-[acyl-carrier protein] reductase [hydrothermal vent metagenome]|uniref:3-oxoacyl-[acyl-carrier protein] reductase n=1 Tax=hydrothermal vent metagenome TaxID=652676 RepID=A0A3B0TM65_9ZZZZ